MLGLRDLVLTVLTLVWAVVLVLVGGRFLALLINADRDSELIHKVLSWSDFWVKPFFNLFHLSNKTVDATGGVFEPASAIAFVVYFVIGLFVLRLVRGATTFGVLRHA
jgi:hypothetical protein